MNRLAIVTSILMALVAAVPTFAIDEVKAVPVSTNLYLITGLDAGNVAFLVTDQGVLVVDAGGETGNGVAIKGAIRKITPQPIRYLILTHHHYDHTFSLSEFPPETVVVAERHLPDYYRESVVEAVPASLAKVKARIEEQQKRIARLETEKNPDAAKETARLQRDRTLQKGLEGFRAAYPQIVYDGKLTIALGGEMVEISCPGPAHTGDDSLVYFVNQKTIHTGDMIFSGSFPYIMRESGSNTANWVSALDQLLKWDIERVIPGHGPVTDKEGIRKQVAYLSDLRAAVQDAMKQGMSLEQMKKAITLPAWRDLEQAEALLPANIEAVHLELEGK